VVLAAPEQIAGYMSMTVTYSEHTPNTVETTLNGIIDWN
jgi:hypothetical protein